MTEAGGTRTPSLRIRIQITNETARQIADLADHWGLPAQRHNTPTVERAIAMVHMLEIGYGEYRRRYDELTEAT